MRRNVPCIHNSGSRFELGDVGTCVVPLCCGSSTTVWRYDVRGVDGSPEVATLAAGFVRGPGSWRI